MRYRLTALAVLVLALSAVPPKLGEPAASAIIPTPPTVPVASPTVSYQTITANPLTIINVARIPAGAAVEIKAVLAPPDARGYFMAFPSDIAKSLGAQVVVNADIHLFNGVPIGGVVTDGIQIRPTVSSHSQLSLDADNHFSYSDHGEIPAGTVQSLGSSYQLLGGGVQTPVPEHSVFTESAQARTLVGWNVHSGEIMFVTVDKLDKYDPQSGMSLDQAAKLMLILGATDAFNLDGGGSTQMVVNGELRNSPSSGARAVSNFWVVIPKTTPPK